MVQNQSEGLTPAQSVNSQVQFLWRECPWIDESDGSKQGDYNISKGEIQGFLYKHRTLILKLLEVMPKDDFCRRLKISPGSLQLFLDKIKNSNSDDRHDSDTPISPIVNSNSENPSPITTTPTDFASWLSKSIDKLEKERENIESELGKKKLQDKQLSLQISILEKARKDYLDRREKIK